MIVDIARQIDFGFDPIAVHRATWHRAFVTKDNATLVRYATLYRLEVLVLPIMGLVGLGLIWAMNE